VWKRTCDGSGACRSVECSGIPSTDSYPLNWWNAVQRHAVDGNVERRCAAKFRPALRARGPSSIAGKKTCPRQDWIELLPAIRAPGRARARISARFCIHDLRHTGRERLRAHQIVTKVGGQGAECSADPGWGVVGWN
jgi:hypothetical protein